MGFTLNVGRIGGESGSLKNVVGDRERDFDDGCRGSRRQARSESDRNHGRKQTRSPDGSFAHRHVHVKRRRKGHPVTGDSGGEEEGVAVRRWWWLDGGGGVGGDMDVVVVRWRWRW